MGNTTSSSTNLTLSSVKMIIVVVQIFLTQTQPYNNYYNYMFQCKLSKKLSFHVMLLFLIPGNPSKRQKTCDNHSSPLHSPPVKHGFSGFPAPVSSMALSSVKINPQDTIKTSNPPTPSPLGRSNSTGNVSNQGNVGAM